MRELLCLTEKAGPARLEWKKDWKQQQQIGHPEQTGHSHDSKLSTKSASGENLKGCWLVKERCFSQLRRTDVVTSSNHGAFIDLGSYICSHFYILYFSETSKQCQVFKGGLGFNMGVVLVFVGAAI